MSSSTFDARQHVAIAEGTFLSPFATGLPSECRQACFQVITPMYWQNHHHDASLSAEEEGVREKMRRLRPIVIVLAGTGEQGYDRRRHLISYPLARLGIASLVLESPFYGKRRPAGQVCSALLLAVSCADWHPASLLCAGTASIPCQPVIFHKTFRTHSFHL